MPIRRLWFVLLLLALLTPQARAYGQAPPAAPKSIPFASIKLGEAIVPLTGPWKFHTGDKLAWAHPDFNDAEWQATDLTPPAGSIDPGLGSSGYIPGWTAQGHSEYSGYAWYRLRVHLDAGTRRLALLMPIDIDDGYQVYADGKLLGGFGDFSGKQPKTYYGQPMMFSLPAADQPDGRDVVLALRFYMKRADLAESPTPGGLHAPPQLGLLPVVSAFYQLQRRELARTYDFYLIPILVFVIAVLAAFTLYALDRSQRVFLWLGAAAAMNVLYLIFVLSAILTTHINDQAIIFRPILLTIVLWTWLMAWHCWFGLYPIRWLRRLIFLLTALVILLEYLQYVFAGRTEYPFFAAGPWGLASRAAHLLLGLLPLVILYLGIRRQGKDGWIAAPALLLLTITVYPDPLVWLHIPLIWFAYGVQIPTRLTAELAISVWVIWLLLIRFQRSQRMQQQLQNEMRQAQQVQLTLLPEAPATLPGFRVESVYRPAEEVGGDFFQVMPSVDGGLLIVLGDVSGKGLRAAMLVSLIVGTLRTLAEQDLSPCELLQGMNRRLHNRMEGGFATCICARICPDGHTTVANAGHLAPYLDGEELKVPNDLPLGIVPAFDYEEYRYHLPAGSRLVFITDGVVEARNRKGELYGFDRTKILIRRPLEEIVRITQNFGQEDDITVIGLLREATAG